MEYIDEPLLNVEEYEKIAKAYANALKSKGFMIVSVDMQDNYPLIKEVFNELYTIKTILFSLGGFLNTGRFYSLNDRQIKKLTAIFDFEEEPPKIKAPIDKTKGLLSFLSCECLLIKNLIQLAFQSNYEIQIKDILNSRLSLLSELLKV